MYETAVCTCRLVPWVPGSVSTYSDVTRCIVTGVHSRLTDTMEVSAAAVNGDSAAVPAKGCGTVDLPWKD